VLGMVDFAVSYDRRKYRFGRTSPLLLLIGSPIRLKVLVHESRPHVPGKEGMGT
jgi:hypothetical protein